MNLGSVGIDVAEALGMEHALGQIAEARGSLPWSSPLAVGTLACDSVALASLALGLARNARTPAPTSPVRVDRARVATSFTSERILQIDGQHPAVWAPLSGFRTARDGFVRTHANYPHHENALRRVLGLGDGADAASVSAAIAERDSVELETAAAQAGAVVGAVRTSEQWREHPQARSIAAAPIVEVTRTGAGRPRAWTTDAAPLAGIRVLDLTRVLAGPIAARDLALAGAEVLRVDAPFLPETGWIHLDTGQGKRSTLLDLCDRTDGARFESLLKRADVVLTGYRPGALTRFGLDPEDLAQRHPGLVTGSVSAWGTQGPWAGRRGFDSIVQAVTGIAVAVTADGETPGTLPAQALDHSTGHFLAAALTMALVGQRTVGGSVDVRMSLARVAHALLDSTDGATVPPDAGAPAAPCRTRAPSESRPFSLTYAPPVLAFDGAPDDYADVGGPWGIDAPDWARSNAS
ncbi:CoA transferase [Microbacterium sp. cx-55]|uniref:CoA transferase n=1 Tax=Microbacterium sp. cx-55 TaxID=2875948 RepID=UPI001CBFC2C4|nr:CoA transferase [Microbacterium sp. cx-55]MBZ4486297.1 CoA transferase [Microbacterium sp. cx-55]UGB33863.1 CoA transferase [Microbacterium sp. cx-55]